MPRLCGLEGNVRCFEIADFTDHDDVRILAEESPQRRRKRQSRLFVDIDLVDAGQVDFGRIFCRGNVHPRLVQQVQACVKRHGLAGASRPRDENHSVGPLNSLEQAGLFFGFIAQGINAQFGAAGIQNPDNNLFAKQGGQRTDAQIHRSVGTDLQFHATVLWNTLFGDVQP